MANLEADRIRIKDLVFSQQYFDHEETGYVLVSGTIISVDEDDEISENIEYSISARDEIQSGSAMTPFDFSFAIAKEDLKIGSNAVTIMTEGETREIFLFKYSIEKEDRDTFLYKRNGRHDASISFEGDVVLHPGEGYGIKETGQGITILPIPTEGKSNIDRIKIEGTPEVREIVTKTYSMDLIKKEDLQNMAHFSKEVSLHDLTIVKRAGLRR
ncbi:hypothetical protein P8918_13415 [Bacillus spizizenii]|nr:hypothetical protein [Bacillus spizizenii]MCY8890567.1 hypothetical protein [Bacillus spizizenii]MEC0842026.1 hypothetical protein [Bacillus spizizenii]